MVQPGVRVGSRFALDRRAYNLWLFGRGLGSEGRYVANLARRRSRRISAQAVVASIPWWLTNRANIFKAGVGVRAECGRDLTAAEAEG